MVDVDACILSHLKEELAWAADKQLQVIIMLLKQLQYKELQGTKAGI